LFQLRHAVGEFDERHNNDDMGTSELEEEHWRHIAAYLKIVEPFEKATKLLGGDTYPAACMVIPMLDQVITWLAFERGWGVYNICLCRCKNYYFIWMSN
jgi:hypothetical protein